MNINPIPLQAAETGTDLFDYKSWRNDFILIVLRIACVLGAALMLFNWSTTPLSDRYLFIGLYVVLLLATVLPAQYSIRASLLLALLFIVGANSVLGWGPWLDGSIFFVSAVALAALLFDQRVDVFILAGSMALYAVIGILEQQGLYQISAPNLPDTTSVDWIAYIVDFSVPSAILIIAINQFKKAFTRVVTQTQTTLQAISAERLQLEDKVRERTEELSTQAAQLNTSTNVAKIVAEVQDIPTLIETATKLISEHFGYYHVGLYILDEPKKIAFLQSASSAAGKQLVGQGFRIESDRRNIINLAVQQNRAVISSDTEDENFIGDANFPLTRSRMLLPLAVRGDVIGLLDLHSEQPRAFSTLDAEILKTLSDLIAISYDNVRLINETRSLVSQLETNTSFQSHKTWAKFTSRQKPMYQYTPAGVRPVFGRDKINSADGLHIPLTLYGQRIGAINLVRRGAVTEWSERERALVEKIAHQVALALENSRLVDEAQKSSLRDQMIANISTRVRETLDVESVIRTAATELRRVFDLKEAEISIGSNQAEASPVRKNVSSIRSK